MNTGLTSHVFPGLRIRELSGAGDEEVFETKASPPAVAGPLTDGFSPAAFWFQAAPAMHPRAAPACEIRP
ncbi:hypothetical protein ABIB45_002181 [Arthrobacter sp. UYCo732]